jgi:hypothetical protein
MKKNNDLMAARKLLKFVITYRNKLTLLVIVIVVLLFLSYIPYINLIFFPFINYTIILIFSVYLLKLTGDILLKYGMLLLFLTALLYVGHKVLYAEQVADFLYITLITAIIRLVSVQKREKNNL